MNKEINHNPRQHGKAYSQYTSYIKSVREGKKAIVVGSEYVVMSMNMYKELKKNPEFTNIRIKYDEMTDIDE